MTIEAKKMDEKILNSLMENDWPRARDAEELLSHIAYLEQRLTEAEAAARAEEREKCAQVVEGLRCNSYDDFSLAVDELLSLAAKAIREGGGDE
jgi:hypothetical protein